MSIRYKVDIISELKKHGYTTYRIQKENIFSNATMQKFRRGEVVTAPVLGVLCRLLNCDVGDILEYREDKQK